MKIYQAAHHFPSALLKKICGLHQPMLSKVSFFFEAVATHLRSFKKRICAIETERTKKAASKYRPLPLKKSLVDSHSAASDNVMGLPESFIHCGFKSQDDSAQVSAKFSYVCNLA